MRVPEDYEERICSQCIYFLIYTAFDVSESFDWTTVILPTHTVNQTAYSMKEAMEQAIYEFEFRGAYPYLADFWGANTSGYCLVGWFGSSFILVVDSIRKHRSQGESKASHKESSIRLARTWSSSWNFIFPACSFLAPLLNCPFQAILSVLLRLIWLFFLFEQARQRRWE